MGLFGGKKDEPVAQVSNKLRILLCEDDMFFRQALSLILGNAGYEVVVMEDGQKGLGALAAGQKFNLILCDIMMPNLDGWGVLRAIQNDAVYAAAKPVPFVFLTGVSDLDSMERATSLGAKDYFIKANTGLPKIVDLVKKYIV